MPDRLQDLLQQRALIKEHLAWLESEITAAAGRPLPVFPPPAAPPPAAPAASPTAPVGEVPLPAPRLVHPASPIKIPSMTAASPAPDAEAEALLTQLAAREKPLAPPDKKGCWLIFSGVLIALCVVAWLLLRHFYHWGA